MHRVLASRDPLHDPEALIPRVYAYVAYRVGHGAQAEDITSETFARALHYRDAFDGAKGTPISWLIGIARRCVNEALSQPRPAFDPPDQAEWRDMEDDALDRLTVQAAVSQLNERDRELIALLRRRPERAPDRAAPRAQHQRRRGRAPSCTFTAARGAGRSAQRRGR